MTEAAEEDTLHFAELSGVRPMIETFPLENAADAYARMMTGKAQFRAVHNVSQRLLNAKSTGRRDRGIGTALQSIYTIVQWILFHAFAVIIEGGRKS